MTMRSEKNIGSTPDIKIEEKVAIDNDCTFDTIFNCGVDVHSREIVDYYYDKDSIFVFGDLR